MFLRRYAAKLAYELELHGGGAIDGLDAVYARRLSEAVRVEWPAVSWLADVDPFFYAARYLRAWALETHLRAALRERFGAAWFDEPEAGAFLRELWSAGQGAAGGRGHPRPQLGGARAGLRCSARADRAEVGTPPASLPQLLLHRVEHRLAVGVTALVVAHLAQLGRAEVRRAGSAPAPTVRSS